MFGVVLPVPKNTGAQVFRGTGMVLNRGQKSGPGVRATKGMGLGSFGVMGFLN